MTINWGLLVIVCLIAAMIGIIIIDLCSSPKLPDTQLAKCQAKIEAYQEHCICPAVNPKKPWLSEAIK